MLYFAYGSNMNHTQMNERCPGSRFIGPAKLSSHKFVYDGYSKTRKGAVANIINKNNSKDAVWGGLFKISKDNKNSLDCYEGYPRVYERMEVTVQDLNGKMFNALVYLRKGEKVGIPSENYHKTVLCGARDCGLPQDYIDSNL